MGGPTITPPPKKKFFQPICKLGEKKRSADVFGFREGFIGSMYGIFYISLHEWLIFMVNVKVDIPVPWIRHGSWLTLEGWVSNRLPRRAIGSEDSSLRKST